MYYKELDGKDDYAMPQLNLIFDGVRVLNQLRRHNCTPD